MVTTAVQVNWLSGATVKRFSNLSVCSSFKKLSTDRSENSSTVLSLSGVQSRTNIGNMVYYSRGLDDDVRCRRQPRSLKVPTNPLQPRSNIQDEPALAAEVGSGSEGQARWVWCGHCK